MRSFAFGAAAYLGAAALLNARVLLFAAGYRRLPAALRDGHAAAVSVQFCLDEYAREMGL